MGITHKVLSLGLAIALAGCGLLPAGLKPIPGTPQSGTALAQKFADNPSVDWTSGLVHSTQLDRIRQERALSASKRHLTSTDRPRKVGDFRPSKPTYSLNSGVIGSQTASSRFDGEVGTGGYYAYTGYFIATNGEIFKYDQGSNSAPSSMFTIDVGLTGDTFPRQMPIVFPDSSNNPIMFLCAASGRFYAVNLVSEDTEDTLMMNGADANVGYTASPCLDYLGSPSGKWILYAINNVGLGYKITYNRSTNQIDMADDFEFPGYSGPISSRTNYYAASPLVVGGKLMVGTWWRRTGSNRTLDKGGFYYYDVSNWDSTTDPTSLFSTHTRVTQPDLIAA